MNTEHATPELFAALASAQAEIENVAKNATNLAFSKDKNKPNYADLAGVLTVIRAALPKHGLSIIQSPSYDGTMAHVTTMIGHGGGGYITSTASCRLSKDTPQGIGDATTYLRRYAAAAMTGIAQEDDDGVSNDGVERITQEQEAELRDLAASVGADMPNYLRYLKIAKLSELRASSFKAAVAALEAKKTRADK